MTIIEAGIIAGIPAGAILGGVLCEASAVLDVAAGSAAGMVLGAAAGWLYALVVICLMSVVGVLWRAARQRADAPLTETDLELMTPIANCGAVLGILVALVFWLSFDWLHALTAAMAIGAATSVAAVARCEFQ